ncbi:MAG: NifU family protein [Vulcanimicrobiaceae bacterium]
MGRGACDGEPHARIDEGVRIITIEERVNTALDKVRPGIQMDGGEVWLIKVEGETAFVQMLGACGGCPASTMTLKGAIETVVCSDVPEIREVVQI